MQLFKLFATLGLNTSDFDSGIDKSASKMQSFASSYTQSFEKIGAKVLKVGAIVGAGVTALGAIGFNYNKQMETYTTDFEVMLGSTEKAVKKVEELKKFSQKTPFELSDLADATKTLLAFNVNADDSTNVLRKLGDISLGNAQKLETLTRAYGKMNSSQKVNLESINMMIDAGYNPLLQIQEDLGVSMEEVYNKISKGEISFEMLENAIASATSEGGQFYQGMEKASQTTEGLISTFKDVVNSKLGEFFAGVNDKVKELLPKIISFVENLDIEEILKNFQSFYDLLLKWAPLITGVVAVLTTMYLIFKAMLIINQVTIAVHALNLALNSNPFILIVSLIAGLIVALITLWNTNEDFRNAVIEIWNALMKAFNDAWTGINTFFNNIKKGFDNTLKSVGEFVDGVVQLFKDLPENLKNIGIDMIKGFWEGIKSMGNWLNEQISGFFGGVTKLVKNIFKIQSPSKVFEALGKFLPEGFVIGIKKGAGAIENTMRDTFGSVIPSDQGNGNTITISVNGVGDPEAVAQRINQLLGGMV